MGELKVVNVGGCGDGDEDPFVQMIADMVTSNQAISDGMKGDKKKQSKKNKHENLESADELVDFDSFFTPESISQLKKCLTRKIWDEYKD